MRKQCVPGAPPFFARTGDEAIPYHAHMFNICQSSIQNCLYLESYAIYKYNKYKPQMKVTETLQMYRSPRTVQLEIVQMYRIDYLLQRHINSAVREATRECASKWIGL